MGVQNLRELTSGKISEDKIWCYSQEGVLGVCQVILAIIFKLFYIYFKADESLKVIVVSRKIKSEE